MTWCIYKHTNKINGKVYIGQTCQRPKERWQNGKGYIGCPKFWAAIEEFGWDAFEHEILIDNISTQDEANEFEQKYIAEYDSYHNGYNSTLGGKGFVYEQEPIYQIDINTHEIIGEFSSMREASTMLDIGYGSIYNSCHYRQRCAGGNWFFRFQKEWLDRKFYVPPVKSHKQGRTRRSDGRVYTSLLDAAKSIGGGAKEAKKIKQAIEKKGKVGGFYWSWAEDEV